MIVDLRDALADLSDEAPSLTPAVADRAIAVRRSRRARHMAAGVAGAALTVVLPFTASTLEAPRPAPPAAPPASASPYVPDIGSGQWPWTSTQLPDRLDEPVLLAIDGAAAGAVATVSGTSYSLGSETAPSISADGWRLASWDAGPQELVVRDFATGRERRFAAGGATEFDGIVIDARVPLRWSPSREAVAVTGTGGEVTVVWAETGEVDEIDSIRGFVAGWLDDDRLLVVGFANGLGQELSQVSLTGGVTSLGMLPTLASDSDVVPTLSPDGRQIAWFELDPSSSAATVEFWHLERGPWGGTGCDCTAMHAPTWLPNGEVLVKRNAAGPQALGTVGETDFDPMIAISPRFDRATGLSLAHEVASAGPSGEPHTSRWWIGWYVDRVVYASVAALLLMTVLVSRLTARRRRSPAGP